METAAGTPATRPRKAPAAQMPSVCSSRSSAYPRFLISTSSARRADRSVMVAGVSRVSGPGRDRASAASSIIALRALLAGQEIHWDGALTGLKHGPRTGIAPAPSLPLYIAAHGPRGYGVAERAGDGIVTNVSHRGGNPPPADMSQVQVLYYGTVLAPGEDRDDPRVLSAAGPYAAFQLHLGDLGVVGDTAECAAFGKEVAEVAEDRRHLELHRAHLLDLTELDRPFVTGELVARTTGSGTRDQVRAGLADIAARGTHGVLYGPMGDDIPRELRAFAEAASTPVQP
jgi:5,10-methylenetetrahydromethanopterin reductase